MHLTKAVGLVYKTANIGNLPVSMDENQSVVCSNCLVSPNHDFERDGETWAACPKCGREDRALDILREAAEYRATQSFNQTLARVADLDGPKDVRLEAAPERSYRWLTR